MLSWLTNLVAFHSFSDCSLSFSVALLCLFLVVRSRSIRTDEARVAQVREHGTEHQTDGICNGLEGHLRGEVCELDQIRNSRQPAHSCVARGDDTRRKANNPVKQKGVGDLASSERVEGEGSAANAGCAEAILEVGPRPRLGHGRSEDGDEKEGDDVNVQPVQNEPTT